MKNIKSVLCMLLCAGMLLGLCACGGAGTTSSANSSAQDDWSYISQKGTLVIGITEYPPLNYYDAAGTLTGFETEFAQAVCDKLGIEAEFVVINWETKEAELKAKTIDCIWNGLTVTDERKENMTFSKSYLENKQVVLVQKDKADKYKTLDDLAGAAISAEAGSAGEDAILANEALSKNYIAVVNQAKACMEVAAGTSDAAVMDYFIALYNTAADSDYKNLSILDLTVSEPEEFGIGLRKDSTAAEKINGAIDALIADGTLQKIADTYNITDSLILK